MTSKEPKRTPAAGEKTRRTGSRSSGVTEARAMAQRCANYLKHPFKK